MKVWLLIVSLLCIVLSVRTLQRDVRIDKACANLQQLNDRTEEDMTYRQTQVIQLDLQCPMEDQ